MVTFGFRSTFGSLKVYFPDLSETIIEERPVYSFVVVVSNLGGLLGLYLGFSLLTLLEIVEFWFDFAEYLQLRGKRKLLEKAMKR